MKPQETAIVVITAETACISYETRASSAARNRQIFPVFLPKFVFVSILELIHKAEG